MHEHRILNKEQLLEELDEGPCLIIPFSKNHPKEWFEEDAISVQFYVWVYKAD